LIGFIESQNAFFVHSNNGKYFTRFSLVLREPNILLLQLIKRLLHIPNTVYVTSNNECVLTTSNSRAILNIIKLFKDQFKGMRSLEFKLWSKANFYLKNTNVKKVNKIDNILRRLEEKNRTVSLSSGSLSSHEVRSIIDFSVYSSSVKKADIKRTSCHPYCTPLGLGLNSGLLPNKFGRGNSFAPLSPFSLSKSKQTQGLSLCVKSRDYSTSAGPDDFKPAMVYHDTYIDKTKILADNKGKSGIYLFTHKETGKKYIGSSFNLRRRFMEYFNPNYLEKANYMYISRAILKHGISCFSLAVLEYCEPEKCIERENFYLSLFKPEYNTLIKAASSLGYVHRLETRKKNVAFCFFFFARAIAQEKKEPKAVDRTGINNPRFGVTVSEETLGKLFFAQKDNCKRIEVLDLHTNETSVYDSIRAAGKALDIKQSRITTYFSQNQSSAYKKRYMFKKI